MLHRGGAYLNLDLQPIFGLRNITCSFYQAIKYVATENGWKTEKPLPYLTMIVVNYNISSKRSLALALATTPISDGFFSHISCWVPLALPQLTSWFHYLDGPAINLTYKSVRHRVRQNPDNCRGWHLQMHERLRCLVVTTRLNLSFR